MTSVDRIEPEGGFTLAEILVTLLVFGVASTAFYQVLFSGAEGSQTARSVVRVSEEARGGLNRMIRDTRQAQAITAATDDGYAIQVDFNGDEAIAAVGVANPVGDYEQLSFVVDGDVLYIQACGAADLDCGNQKSVLVDGVSRIGSTPYFSYSSNRLEYDCNNNGQASRSELEAGSCYVTGGLTPAIALVYLTDIDYSIRVTFSGRSSDFLSHSEMRNLR
jgi:prepilin-type N-terminal cleavage/methylation domain-containing protein